MSTASVIEQAGEHSDDAERRAFRAFGEVIRITTELFGEVHVKESFDPEFAEEKYVVFVVRAPGTSKELMALERQWIEQVRQVARNWESFRLSLRPLA
ncbi:hypothetical protein [Anatilimnocola floriformis]|uniref:hypothetical protein n=1 Tax=Anatilimnocola floriformis TaxID=2948575 RepID=UPI0020C2F4FE|nr:hypothetical protein [Anatilimnocola floriformis]